MSINESDSLLYAQEYLEAKFNNGEFQQIVEHLFDCVEDNRAQIETLLTKSAATTSAEKLSVIKEYLESRKSIHLPSEMADQIKEISKEVWYRGEEGEKNIPKIREEWSQTHATSWRQARLIEMKFIVDKMSTDILALFK